MHSFYKDADTILYRNDTILKFTKKNTLSDIQLVVTSEHTFNPTIRTVAKRERILYGDSCLFTINHDCLTSIELFYRDYYGGEDIPFWQSKVDNEKSFTFTFPEYPEEHKSTRFYIRFTTLHYGTYVSSVFSSY